MPASLHDLVYAQLDTLDPSVRIVVLQPNFAAQHAILPGLLERDGCVYVRLEGSSLSAEQVRQQVEQTMAAQHGGDLRQVGTLIVDEFDRLKSDAAADVLPWLTFEGPRQQVVLLCRRVPYIVLEDERLRRHTRFLPADENLMLWDYSRHDGDGPALLEVRALGAGRVHLNGRPVEDWDGVLPRSLFFYIVDRGMTTRSDIFETFWPNLSSREATNVFHVTKRKISEVLGMDLTVYWSGFYHIAPTVELSYDAALFSSTVQDSAVVPDDEVIVLLHRALGLYRGDFLTTVDMPWVHKRRQELRQTYGEALVALAKSTEALGELRRALGLYLRAATTNRQREDLAVSIMRLYSDLDMPEDALATYDMLEAALKTEYNMSPGALAQELVTTLRANRS